MAKSERRRELRRRRQRREKRLRERLKLPSQQARTATRTGKSRVAETRDPGGRNIAPEEEKTD